MYCAAASAFGGSLVTVGVSTPADRGLLDDLAIVAAMQVCQRGADRACLLDDRLEIHTGTLVRPK